MRIGSVNSVNYNNYQSHNENKSQPAFGRVIKTRFFEVLEDGSRKQIQDEDLISKLWKRLSFHLTAPAQERKGRISSIPKALAKIDKEYKDLPLVRRIFNFNRNNDKCFYIITGEDAAYLESVARLPKSDEKNAQIIESHWQLVRSSKKRLYNENLSELSLSIFVKSGKHPKTKKDCYLYKGISLGEEKHMQPPYRTSSTEFFI